MPESLLPPGGCCTPCDDIPVTNVPGPTGAAGAAGANATDGTNAHTTTTAVFAMPAAAATVSVLVNNTTWATVGQFLFIQTAGIMEITAIPDTSTFTLENTGATGNAVATTSIPIGSTVSPGGPEGVTSLTGAAGGDLTGTYPNPTLSIPATVGGLVTSDGATRIVLAKGTQGQSLKVDTTTATDLVWSATDLSDTNQITGATGLANGGTGQITANLGFNALSPSTTEGDIVFRNATINAALAIGTAGQVLKTNAGATAPEWASGLADTAQWTYSLAATNPGASIALNGWNTVPLNSEDYDTGNLFAGVLPIMSFPVGTFRFRYKIVASTTVDGTEFAGRLFDNTAPGAISGSESLTIKPTRYDSNVNNVIIEREGRFTLANPSSIILQINKVTNNAATYGTNIDVQQEVYATLTVDVE